MVTKKIDLTKPGHQIIDVTPQLAKDWLLLNKHNRKLKEMKIVQYARDMREGNWRFTGEAIKFDNNGDLLDGQNRLHALIDAQTTVPMLVVTGLEPEAQGVMDSNAPRNAGDTLTLHGYKNPNELAGTVRAHYLWQKLHAFKHCMSSPYSEQAPTNSEILNYVEAHPDLSTASIEAKPISRQLRISHGAVGAAYCEFSLIDAEEAGEFLERIRELRTAGKGDPVNALVKRCQDMALRREFVRASTSLFMIVKTWNAVRAGERFEKFQFGSDYRGWAAIPEPK
jgi:hypothetical protein